MNIDWTKVDAVAGGLTKSELFNESLFALGGSYSYEGLVIPAPTAGSLVMLETLESSYVTSAEDSDYDVDLALYVLSMGKAIVGAVFEDRLFDIDINNRVDEFIKSIPKYNRTIIKVFITSYFKYAMNGFDMIPGSESEPKKMRFDTDWLMGHVSVCHKITGHLPEYIIWEMPLTMGGFCLARYGKENGQKNIERWEDTPAMLAEIKRQYEDGK